MPVGWTREDLLARPPRRYRLRTYVRSLEVPGHAELQLGDGVIMIADEYPEMGVRGPKSIGGTPVTLSLYVEDVDAVFDAAVAAGATSLRLVADQFYGDRSGQFEDPFGHRWSVASHVEDVSAEEMSRRAAEANHT